MPMKPNSNSIANLPPKTMTKSRPLASGLCTILTVTALTQPLMADSAVANFTFPTNTRIGAQAGYYRHYVPSEGWAARMSWTGSLSTCTPGTVSAAYFDDSLRRVNYYRAQVGLLSDITHNATKSEKSQWAALIFSKEDNISHTPATSFPTNACVLADIAAHGGNGWGHESAGAGNIGYGSTGPDSINALMVDSGSSNTAVGHRRWFLYPREQEMGFGGVPTTPTQVATTCVWVIGNSKPASASTVKLTTWPNAGFIPYHLTPNATNTLAFGGQIRWSCGYTNGNFSAAAVTMTRTTGAGAPVAVAATKETYNTTIADNTMVWKISSSSALVVPTATQDINYQVTITGITLTTGSPPPEFVSTGGGTYSYTYNVTTFDETYLPTPMTLTGSAAPATGLSNAYTVSQLPESSGLKVRVGTTAASTWTEGAEDSPTPKVIDGTTYGYALRVASASFPAPANFAAASGTKVFHLAIGGDPAVTQSFTIDRVVIPTASSRLTFKHRFHNVTTATSLNAEISTNGGSAWTTLWTRPGDAKSSTGSSASWETTWQTGDVAIPATYVGKTVMIRFSFSFNNPLDTFFTSITGSGGAFVDDISVTAASELTTVSTTELAATATSFSFVPPANGTYLLQAQMELGDTHYFDWSYSTVTSAAPTAIQTWRNTNFSNAANSSTAADVADPDKDGLPNVVEYAFGLNPNTPDAKSVNLPAVSNSGNNITFTFKPSTTATGLTYTVQQSTTLAADSWSPVTTSVANGIYTATVPVSGAHKYLRLKVDNASGL